VKVVIDTNVIVSGIFWGGNAYKILDAYTDDKFSMVVSPSILQEYTEVLLRLGSKKEKKLVAQWIALFVDDTEIVDPQNPIRLCRDPKDNKFLECLMDGECNYLITGDNDLLVLKDYFPDQIITPVSF